MNAGSARATRTDLTAAVGLGRLPRFTRRTALGIPSTAVGIRCTGFGGGDGGGNDVGDVTCKYHDSTLPDRTFNVRHVYVLSTAANQLRA